MRWGDVSLVMKGDSERLYYPGGVDPLGERLIWVAN
jgi:hypothetical protein